MKKKESFIRHYISYIKDNPEGYWFKRRLYGWGWVPAKLQGWLIVLAFLVFVLSLAFGLSSGEPSPGELGWFYAKLVVSIAILIVLCCRTGEKPHWSWGK